MTVVSAADAVVPLVVGLATVAVGARVASIAVTRVAATQALTQKRLLSCSRKHDTVDRYKGGAAG